MNKSFVKPNNCQCEECVFSQSKPGNKMQCKILHIPYFEWGNYSYWFYNCVWNKLTKSHCKPSPETCWAYADQEELARRETAIEEYNCIHSVKRSVNAT